MLSHREIRCLLPHRHPVLLVDRATSVTEGERIETVKAVSGAEPCYAGIADDAPDIAYRFPETLLVESFAQSGALLWLASAQARGERLDGVGMVAVISDCEFRSAVYPGDVVRHQVELERVLGENVVFSGVMRVDDRLIATVGSVIATFRPGGTLASSEVASTMNAAVSHTLL